MELKNIFNKNFLQKFLSSSLLLFPLSLFVYKNLGVHLDLVFFLLKKIVT